MPGRKTKRNPHGKEKAEVSEKPKKQLSEKELLKLKLKEKLRVKKLERNTLHARDNMAEKLEERLEDAKTKDEKRAIKKELSILEDIEDRQAQSMNDDYPEYNDE